MSHLSARGMLLAAACLLFVGVAAGAFGAHALRARVSAEALTVYHTAVLYHLVHALGLVAVGLLALHWPDAGAALGGVGLLLIAGVALFSGSLYALVLTGTRALGIVTPLGGLAFLAAWLLLAWTIARH